ncbi:GAF domain-containing sensor histidine kinase [Arthrobacter sp. PsM3]|uniref:GAF domain-containing sensor histidine kinase n=1 Tax=Arthrobacter sp. PsM3 TaxID=3030531 RepID=UPI0034616B33
MKWRNPMKRRAGDLLRESRGRADELLYTQDRLRGLLSAVVSLTDDLSLEAVLDRLVHSACELTGARYGALGVIGGVQALSQFITVGVDGDGIRMIGEPPRGRGVLGHLIRDPQPMRLHDLGGHPAAAGFPPNHPPMKTFLGVPVRVRDTVFGNLYLTEKQSGADFTEEDEELAVALAAAAGIAIENARIFEDSRRLQGWLEAGMEISGKLITAVHPDAAEYLDLIAERARTVSGSALSVIAVPGPDGVLRCRVSLGEQSLPAGFEIPASTAITGVLETGESAVFPDPAQLFGVEASRKMGPVLLAALGHTGTSNGLLILGRPAGADGYPQSDLESSALFGSRIGLALDLVRANQVREEHLLFADRDRIAKDLHDLVIQRLFAAGLSIQSLRRYTDNAVAHERIAGATSELDATIRELRATIYSLQDGQDGAGLLTDRALRAVQAGARDLGFTPTVQLTGPLDDTVSEELAAHLLRVLSEGLSNSIRHSGAKNISISLTAGQDNVELLITDDGRGFENPARISGLANMEQRAASLGGTFSIDSPPGHGTRLCWTAPTT